MVDEYILGQVLCKYDILYEEDTDMKKKLACLLALLLMVTSVLGSTTVASAANGNARGGGTEYDKIRITGISFPEFSEEGYYPASLEQLLLTFEGVVSYKII